MNAAENEECARFHWRHDLGGRQLIRRFRRYLDVDAQRFNDEMVPRIGATYFKLHGLANLNLNWVRAKSRLDKR